MKIKVPLVFILGCGIGFFGCFFWKTNKRIVVTTADHWRAIEDFHKRIHDPSKYVSEPAMGASSVELTDLPEPHLAALVAAGEARQFDLVLPNVPLKNRKANQFWMRFCDRFPEILYATGNPEYADVLISGEQPMHLNVWVRKGSEGLVDELIKELQAIGAAE